MPLLFQFFLLILGFTLLIVGADKFVSGASGIAAKLKIPQIIIGLTIVAMGTSAPEAAVSISGSLSGNADISVGNVIGSNILNIFLILGITGSIIPLVVVKDVVKRDIPIMILATLLLIITSLNGEISFVDGILYLSIFSVYLGFLLKSALKDRKCDDGTEKKVEEKSAIILLIMTILGLVSVVIGSKVTVSSASSIATYFGMSERLIGLTIVAFGTSLPELITSTIAAKKGNADIAIGNVVGSNLFNILFVLGLSSLICPLPVSSNFIIDNIISLVACILLGIYTIKDTKLSRKEAISFLIAYGGYFIFLLNS